MSGPSGMPRGFRVRGRPDERPETPTGQRVLTWQRAAKAWEFGRDHQGRVRQHTVARTHLTGFVEAANQLTMRRRTGQAADLHHGRDGGEALLLLPRRTRCPRRQRRILARRLSGRTGGRGPALCPRRPPKTRDICGTQLRVDLSQTGPQPSLTLEPRAFVKASCGRPARESDLRSTH